MPGLELHVLGCGDAMGSGGRLHSSFLLSGASSRVLVDCGSTGLLAIKRFGVDDFDERVRATEAIVSFGPAAIGPLRAASRDSDPEVAFRARQALKRLETVPHTAVAAAAVRAPMRSLDANRLRVSVSATSSIAASSPTPRISPTNR